MQLNMIYAYEKMDENSMSFNVMNSEEKQGSLLEDIEKLTKAYKDIFTEPTSLPPFRANHNHKIVLKEGSDPVNQRPYRYAVH